ncbi:low affinity immunoglobulin gamma Fc region receptor II-a-like isoform X2 [Plectropomus leopardus]|uniref:low affinity immunoglobulin gamma Fc region receptor II-a-like isoform X2 n=1 Tax=Plectropomus leopardus TaxID=160734 RepID=UPI001C4D149C|nr:low affinity immunoglobulin gamma Fc region receptor II-a-like isoform X2 [Plectropomus leopardus]
MEVRAFRIRLLMNVVLLLVAHVQESYPQTADAAFRIIPSRLQLFEYESVHFTCEGFDVSAAWKVRTETEFVSKCSNGTEKSTVSCSIDFVLTSDSGEYWCEAGGKKSNAVNISVTAGSVILESPVLPVVEGDAVTLSCRHKTPSNLSAVFFKDGLFIGSSSAGNMTIHRVDKSDEGLYKCDISGAGESPESRLAVRRKCGDVILESPALPVTEGEAVTLRCRAKETPACLKADFFKNGVLIRSGSAGEMTIRSVSTSDEGVYECRISGAGVSPQSWLAVRASDKEIHFSRHYYILLWVAVTVVLFLQLLVIGLLFWKKQLVLLEANMCDPNMDLYTVDRKDAADADNLSFGLEKKHDSKPQTEGERDKSLPSSYSTFNMDGALQAL